LRKRHPAFTFYEECKINGSVRIKEETPKGATLELSPKLFVPVSFSREVFVERNGRIYKGEVVFIEGNEVFTTPLKACYDPRLRRKSLWVATSLENPIEVEIETLEEEKIGGKAVNVSENGIGVFLKGYSLKDRPLDFEEDVFLRLDIFLEGDRYFVATKGVVKRIEPHAKGLIVGIAFKGLSQKARDKIYRYIVKRQKDLASLISAFNLL